MYGTVYHAGNGVFRVMCSVTFWPNSDILLTSDESSSFHMFIVSPTRLVANCTWDSSIKTRFMECTTNSCPVGRFSLVDSSFGLHDALYSLMFPKQPLSASQKICFHTEMNSYTGELYLLTRWRLHRICTGGPEYTHVTLFRYLGVYMHNFTSQHVEKLKWYEYFCKILYMYICVYEHFS